MSWPLSISRHGGNDSLYNGSHRRSTPIEGVADMASVVRRALLSLLILFPVAVPAQDDAAQPDTAEEATSEDFFFDREGQRCIITRSIRDTDVIDDGTILFLMRGGEFYVNPLDRNCRGLTRERRFSYRISAGRLCSIDSIRVLQQFGNTVQEGVSCGLGRFYPVTEEEAVLLRMKANERGTQMEVENPNEGEEED